MVLNTEWAQVEVIDLINDGSGLAFGIIGGRSTGVVVKTIVPGGVADRDGRLQSGDHILQIGEVNLRGLGSEQVASVLRQCGVHVRMVVARPIEISSQEFQGLDSQVPIVPTKILGDPVELDRHLIENGFGDIFSIPSTNFTTPFIYTGQQTDIQLHTVPRLVDVRNSTNGTITAQFQDVVQPQLVSFAKTIAIETEIEENPLPETEMYTVQLRKDDLGLGITVAGYVCEKEEISGIFVKSISKGSAADINGKIKINDRIVEVDGCSVVGQTNHQAVEMLRNSGSTVTITLERYLRGPKYEQLQLAIRANELKPPSPPSPSISSLPKIPLSLMTSSIEVDGESRTSIDFDSAILVEDATTPTNGSDKEIVIDGGKKTVQFSISSHEAVHEKWKNVLSNEAEVVIAEMSKDGHIGLGISLEGTVDVEGGQEVRPHHYIRNILPNGPVGKNGILQSGDELLEVNGIQLIGLNHLEVVSILKQLPNFVMMVCARYSVDTRIIDTGQCRDAFEARVSSIFQNILAESLQTLIPKSDRLVKAKSDTSIASNSFGDDNPNSYNMGNRSKSLETGSGFPMWNSEYTEVVLNKGDFGLGFSILDYQDPFDPTRTVIVIRSLVPGGVAQADGKLIPGDRLIAVNDIIVEHTSLDRAVQVLKSAPKGIVKIKVAKPLSSMDNISHHSQDTDQEDQTYLDEFQECIEEYQECLEVVQICIDEDVSFSHSSSAACPDELPLSVNHRGVSSLQGAVPCLLGVATDNQRNNGSELDLSFKSTCDLNGKDLLRTTESVVTKMDFVGSEPSRVQQQEETSEKDGYETCVDESFSDEGSKDNEGNEKTPTNSIDNIKSSSSSEPYLKNIDVDYAKTNHICFDSKLDELSSFDHHQDISGDEFFLVQCSKDDLPVLKADVLKFCSDSRVLESSDSTPTVKYRRCIKEYYNDYADCLESYKNYVQKLNEIGKQSSIEMNDDDIFNDIILPHKSKSAPDILDNSFVTMTYDPGPDVSRRKSVFISGYADESDSMTVIRGLDTNFPTSKPSELPGMLQKHWGSIRKVEIGKEPNASIGISIVGGKVDINNDSNSESLLGIFIKNVVPDSPAGRSGQLNTGDRILEVSGVDLREASHDKAVEAIRNSPNPVVFLIQSLIPWGVENCQDIDEKDNYEEEDRIAPAQYTTKEPISNNSKSEEVCSNIPNHVPSSPRPSPERKVEPVSKPPEESTIKEEGDTPKVLEQKPIYEESSEESEDEEDVREMEGRTVSKKGQEIDRASAANLKRTKEEIAADPEEEDDFGYTMNKVKKKYASLGHSILMVQLERGGQGLGLSLAGHKDRNCMAVFVCGINPTGAAYRTGGIQVGDEILEVNGVVLHGRCHLNASAIIKSLSGPIFKVIILRRKAAIDDIAVRPITQFPVSLAEEASEEHFNTYPNVRTITVKKGPQGLGIMIIEGKHTDVGQGIFISDIQEGSSAEKAGLEIGEMILAVNKEPLLGSNYDNAATLLKRTEGLVTLIVSNPTKKPTTPDGAVANDVGANVPNSLTANNVSAKSALKPSATPSRPTTPVPEVHADPTTCPIIPGKDTQVEITTENKVLGIFFIGGKDTPTPEGIIIVEVYGGGVAEKDGRLQPGDQIMEVNGTLLKDVTHTTASQALRQTLPKMKLTIYRPEKLDYQTIETDLVKKPGKGLGLSVIARKDKKGVYISEILSGGIADLDGKIMKGDLLVSVNGQSVDNVPSEEAGAVLKTAAGKVTLKFNRYKAINR
nr:multiple PDZ domain protein-like isoform X1 [Onthophagus taurus]